jgi:hypothetical protein
VTDWLLNCCWSSPAQRFLVPSSAEHTIIFYCLSFEISSTWRTRSLYLCLPKSKSGSLYDWRFTANQFFLASAPWDPRPDIFFQVNSCGNSPYVTSSLTRRWVCLL